jgi:putative redox protein
MKTNLTWRDEMTFDVQLQGHGFAVDSAEEFGGRDLGPRPKPLLLSSLAGCTGMDVLAILKKMRVEIAGLEVSAEGELVADHPKRFAAIRIEYAFRGDDLPVAKLRRAVQLSEERYCGVRASLHPDIGLSSKISVNGEQLAPSDGDSATT